MTITVYPLSPAIITPGGPTTFCDGGSVTLTANDGESYQWSTSDITKSIIVTTPGTYTVTVTNGNFCPNTSAPVTVTVNSVLSLYGK